MMQRTPDNNCRGAFDLVASCFLKIVGAFRYNRTVDCISGLLGKLPLKVLKTFAVFSGR